MNRTINELLAYHDLAPEAPFPLSTVLVRESPRDFLGHVAPARTSPDPRCTCVGCVRGASCSK